MTMRRVIVGILGLSVAFALGFLAHHLFHTEGEAATVGDPWAAAKVGRPVKGLQDAFRVVAKEEGLPADDATVFNLAADSTIYLKWDSPATGRLFAVMPEYRGTDRIGSFRSASGNGSIYIFQVTSSQPRLVGKSMGNSCYFKKNGDAIEATTTFHLSATEWGERTYAWNGVEFVQISHTMRSRSDAPKGTESVQQDAPADPPPADR